MANQEQNQTSDSNFRLVVFLFVGAIIGLIVGIGMERASIGPFLRLRIMIWGQAPRLVGPPDYSPPLIGKIAATMGFVGAFLGWLVGSLIQSLTGSNRKMALKLRSVRVSAWLMGGGALLGLTGGYAMEKIQGSVTGVYAATGLTGGALIGAVVGSIIHALQSRKSDT
jgi:hypothetical protein